MKGALLTAVHPEFFALAYGVPWPTERGSQGNNRSRSPEGTGEGVHEVP